MGSRHISQPVAMIGGNHEPYGDSLYASIAANRKHAVTCSQGRRNPIRFLERETWEVTALDGTPVRVIAVDHLRQIEEPAGKSGNCLQDAGEEASTVATSWTTADEIIALLTNA